MISWNNLIKSHREGLPILKNFTKQRLQRHYDQKLDCFESFAPIEIEKDLLDKDCEEKDRAIFSGVNYATGDLQSDVYEKSILRMTHYPSSHDLVKKLNSHFGTTFGYAIRSIQAPGQVVPPHSDLNGDWSKVYGKDFDPDQLVKAMIFLEDWQLGQMITFGTSALINWKKNDSITFKWYMPHSTANASTFDRPVLAYYGIKT